MAEPKSSADPRMSAQIGPVTTAIDGQQRRPVVLEVQTPTVETRRPADVVVVVDTSGSMNARARIKTADGQTEQTNLSLLDIAKHGVRTIIHTLGPSDRLAVVQFNQEAKTTFDLTAMDPDGQATAGQELGRLQEAGGTNIQAALLEACSVLERGLASCKGRLAHVMLLTDGQTRDRQQVMPALKAYAAEKERLPGTFSTFGFGYDIDSPLLTDIATFGCGTYSFIPDPGFVGTVFINTLSNLLCTFARDVRITLTIEGAEGESGKIFRIMGMGGVSEVKEDGSAIVRLGTLQYEQPRSVVALLPPDVSGELVANLTYSLGGEQQMVEVLLEQPLTPPLAEEASVEVEWLRCLFVEAVERNVARIAQHPPCKMREPNLALASTEMRDLAELVKANGHARMNALLEDLQGQCLEALSRLDWYNRWGCHYMPSIMFAHAVQQCNNFKDPSVQVYGGKMFVDIQTMADEKFDALPPPTPRDLSSFSRPSSAQSGVITRPAPAPAPVVSMAMFNDRYGVCIDAATHARLAGGLGSRAVGELKRGDRLEALDSGAAEVECIVRTPCLRRRAPLVEVRRGVRLTPFHPMLSEGAWRFPAELGEVEEFDCDSVCSLLLSGSPAVWLGEGEGAEGAVAALALAHGLRQGAATHGYFGGPGVAEDLRGAPGYAEGLVEIGPENVVRDPATGHVSRFVF